VGGKKNGGWSGLRTFRRPLESDADAAAVAAITAEEVERQSLEGVRG
jgi:hypothetical protein